MKRFELLDGMVRFGRRGRFAVQLQLGHGHAVAVLGGYAATVPPRLCGCAGPCNKKVSMKFLWGGHPLYKVFDASK